MHAYLLIGNSVGGITDSLEKMKKRLQAKVMEYPLNKIDDVRNLNNLIRLSFNEPTLIFCENIQDATPEALNAFLKNLEEPQENLYFVLTAPSVKKVLPTIVSRCQIIKTINNSQLTINNEEAKKFLSANLGERLALIDKYKDRTMAIELTENLIESLHASLHHSDGNFENNANNLEVMIKTLTNLKANGNINLQLTNMVVSLI